MVATPEQRLGDRSQMVKRDRSPPRMADLGPVAWPPAPIRTERLVLRAPESRDRAAVIELNASPEVGA